MRMKKKTLRESQSLSLQGFEIPRPSASETKRSAAREGEKASEGNLASGGNLANDQEAEEGSSDKDPIDSAN